MAPFPPNHIILVFYTSPKKLKLVSIHNIVCNLHQQIIQVGFVTLVQVVLSLLNHITNLTFGLNIKFYVYEIKHIFTTGTSC